MNANPLTIRYGYHLARWRGKKRRASYCRTIAELPSLQNTGRPSLPIEVVCMLGRGGMPDATLAFRSLVKNAGRPERLTLVSDGTLTSEDAAVLTAAIPGAGVVELTDMLAPDLPAAITDRISDSWMVAKQALLMSLPQEMPALFIDSDIVFFQGADRLARDLEEAGDRPCFMVDVTPNFDERLLTQSDPLTPPVNSGLLYAPKRLDWCEAVNRFAVLPRDGGLSFTDQTMSHLAFHGEAAIPFDPTSYVLTLDDQFEYQDRHARRQGVVCRHYVNTIRHKMWMLQL